MKRCVDHCEEREGGRGGGEGGGGRERERGEEGERGGKGGGGGEERERCIAKNSTALETAYFVLENCGREESVLIRDQVSSF